MRTNTTVQRFELSVPYLHQGHLAAITDSLMENDTLRSCRLRAENIEGIIFTPLDARAEFFWVMAWNVSLQELSIECIRDNEMDSFDRLDLGEPIKAALERNCEAFTVAQVLGQVARQSNRPMPMRHQGDTDTDTPYIYIYIYTDSGYK